MESTLFSQQEGGNSDAGAREGENTLTSGGNGAAGDSNDGNNNVMAQQNHMMQQQFQQQQQQPVMNNMFMGLSGFSGAGEASNNLFGMGANMGQNYLMPPQQLQQQPPQQQPQQPQQQLFTSNGFPQGLTPQMFGAPAIGNQQQQPSNPSDLDQTSANQGNMQPQQQQQQQLHVQNQPFPQYQQPGGAASMQQFQQLQQQFMMAQQLLGAGGGMGMPGNFSAATSLFPLAANNPLMGNLMGGGTGAVAGGQPQLMGGAGGMWPGLGQHQMPPQAPPQQQQLMNNPNAAMNYFLSGLGNGANAQAIMQPPQQAPPQQQPAAAVQPLSAEGKLTSEEWAEPFFGKGKKEPPFPLKLHQILGNAEFAECISWNAHGRSWRILKPPVFEQIVIPLYFRYVL
jgi:hypothetical protein